MKTTLALTALSTKLAMLLCVSSMGFLGVMQESKAAVPLSPCHQALSQDNTEKEPCQLCETALTAWEENAVATSKVTLTEITELALGVDSLVETFAFKIKPLEGVYQAYYPPPQVLLKAVTPNTKTIVLLS